MSRKTDRTIKMCVDRVLQDDRVIPAAEAALRENAVNEPLPRPGGTTASFRLRMAIETRKMWKPGRTLNIRFLGGLTPVRNKVAAIARGWMQHANVRLNFGSAADAEIRIAFLEGQGSWSAVGTDALERAYFPLSEPTMNFGWLDEDTADDEYERVVLHEFGTRSGASMSTRVPAPIFRGMRKRSINTSADRPTTGIGRIPTRTF